MTETKLPELAWVLKSIAEQTIKKLGLINSSDKILAAVSGGPDSMAMLVVLHDLSTEMGFKIGVAHVNHSLRGAESDGDAAFVEEYVKELGLEFHITKVDVNAYRLKHGLSPEEAARDVRFSFLNEVMKNFEYTKIATAHHSGDNAELVLMNLIRGTGPDGLEGMRPYSPEKKIVRPFIHASRSDISLFIENTYTPFRIDSSNNDESLLRNSIRKRLIPHIENKFNGRIRDALNRLSDIIAVENDYMNNITNNHFHDVIIINGEDEISLRSNNLKSLHEAISRRIIRKAIDHIKGNLKRISQSHIEGILGLASKDYDCEMHMPGRIRALRNGDVIILRKEKESLRTPLPIPAYRYLVEDLENLPLEIDIPQAGLWIRFREAKKEEINQLERSGADRIIFEKAAISLPIVIRNTKPGDIFYPMGMKGSKTVLRFLMDMKIPESQRKIQAIMESGDTVLWILGKRISEKLRLKDSGSNYIIAEIFYPD